MVYTFDIGKSFGFNDFDESNIIELLDKAKNDVPSPNLYGIPFKQLNMYVYFTHMLKYKGSNRRVYDKIQTTKLY